jgi:hypothetical protein
VPPNTNSSFFAGRGSSSEGTNPPLAIAIRNDSYVAITRPPAKARDTIYAFLFLFHLALIRFLPNTFNFDETKNAFITHGKQKLINILIFIVIVGIILGGCYYYALILSDSRQEILSISLIFSVVYQVCLGNMLVLFENTHFLLQFIGVILLLMAYMEWSTQYSRCKANLASTCEFIDMAVHIGKRFGLQLPLACVFIVALQTGFISWWGLHFMNISSNIDSYSLTYVSLFMAFSLYWITQFFRGMMSFIVGGCILRHLSSKSSNDDDPEIDSLSSYILFYSKCAFSTSFGTICKGALFCPIAQVVLGGQDWSNVRPNTCCSLKSIVAFAIEPLLPFASRNCRLAFPLAAVYGKTLNYSSETHLDNFPCVLRILHQDTTNKTLSSSSMALAGLFSIVFLLLSVTEDRRDWAALFLITYTLLLCGISLVGSIYSSAVDSLIVSFTLNPNSFATENRILYLRLVRHAEDIS